MHDRETMVKIAYLRGIEKAAREVGADTEDLDMVKEAIVGRALTALGSGLARGTGAALRYGVGKPLAALGRGAGRQISRMGRWAGKQVGRGLYRPATYAAPAEGAAATGLRGFLGIAPKGAITQHARGLIPEVGRFAKNIAGFGYGPAAPGVAAAPMSKAFRALTFGGRQVPATMLQYGGFGGVMGGLTGGQPGEGWSWSGAGKGFLGGAAGGLGWAAGSRAARAGLGKMFQHPSLLKGGRLAGLGERGRAAWGIGAKQPGFWSQRIGAPEGGKTFAQLWNVPRGGGAQSVLRGLGQSAKDVGAKAALGVPIAAGALGGSMLAEDVASRALGGEGAPAGQQVAGRGAYAMTPGGSAPFYPGRFPQRVPSFPMARRLAYR